MINVCVNKQLSLSTNPVNLSLLIRFVLFVYIVESKYLNVLVHYYITDIYLFFVMNRIMVHQSKIDNSIYFNVFT